MKKLVLVRLVVSLLLIVGVSSMVVLTETYPSRSGSVLYAVEGTDDFWQFRSDEPEMEQSSFFKR